MHGEQGTQAGGRLLLARARREGKGVDRRLVDADHGELAGWVVSVQAFRRRIQR